MQVETQVIEGDTVGTAHEFKVMRFAGTEPQAPTAYIQAALHAGELPGVVAIDALLPMLRKAGKEGRILGNITVVPWANPVGRAQYLYGDHQGRFHLGTRTNFNRDFPLLDSLDKMAAHTAATLNKTADARLKQRLLKLSVGHDIVLDLHCDDEGPAYLYVPRVLWPAMADCAAALGAAAVVLWDKDTDGTFEGASIEPYLTAEPHVARFDRRVVTTVELRGLRDVGRDLASHDAAGIYQLLVARGVLADAALARPGPFTGVVGPISHVEMVNAPVPGAILFDAAPGDHVEAGQRLATILHRPGEDGGGIDIPAPQAGYVLTRNSRRSARLGDNLFKIIGAKPAISTREGALED